MISKDKVINALEHREVSVPIDFGSNAVTGIHVSVLAELRDYYGLAKRPVKINEPYQMLGQIDEDLKSAVGVDVDGLYPPGTFFGFRNQGWKEWQTPWNQDVLVPENFVTSRDGDYIYIYPQGDDSVPPSGKMPDGGFVFNSIHNVQANTPIENVVAMIDAVHEFNGVS